MKTKIVIRFSEGVKSNDPEFMERYPGYDIGVLSFLRKRRENYMGWLRCWHKFYKQLNCKKSLTKFIKEENNEFYYLFEDETNNKKYEIKFTNYGFVAEEL